MVAQVEQPTPSSRASDKHQAATLSQLWALQAAALSLGRGCWDLLSGSALAAMAHTRKAAAAAVTGRGGYSKLHVKGGVTKPQAKKLIKASTSKQHMVLAVPVLKQVVGGKQQPTQTQQKQQQQQPQALQAPRVPNRQQQQQQQQWRLEFWQLWASMQTAPPKAAAAAPTAAGKLIAKRPKEPQPKAGGKPKQPRRTAAKRTRRPQ